MLKQRNNLCLDYIIDNNGIQLALKEGLIIKALDNTDWVPIAYIYWDHITRNCFIQTIEDRFQTYIVLYETFCDFIYLVDDAFDQILMAH